MGIIINQNPKENSNSNY